MQTMFEAYKKAQKAGKSKKRKSCNYDSSDSSDSEQETGHSNTGFSIDNHFKIDKPLGSVYLSTETHPIKVTNTAPSNNMRADEIAIETAKAGKVTAVVAIMSQVGNSNFWFQFLGPPQKAEFRFHFRFWVFQWEIIL